MTKKKKKKPVPAPVPDSKVLYLFDKDGNIVEYKEEDEKKKDDGETVPLF